MGRLVDVAIPGAGAARRVCVAAPEASGDGQRAVIVAVVAVRMVQVALDEVVHVVAVGQGFVAAAWAVLVVGGVGSAVVLRSAGDGILRADLDRMLVVVALVGVMEVAVVQIVDVTVVFDGGVSAAGAVDMLMGMMDYVFGHDVYSFDFPTTCASPA